MKTVRLFFVAIALVYGPTWHSIADTTTISTTNNSAAAKFYLIGGDGVIAPGRFVHHTGITLTNTIKLAGGFEKWALKTKVEIIRKGRNAAFVVNVARIEAGETNDISIEPDDYVYVPRVKTIRLRDSGAGGR